MKPLYTVALVLLLSTPRVAFASEPKASDFPITFTVDSFVYSPADDCRMTLVEGNKTFNVRWHYDDQQIFRRGCPAHTSGEHWQGRIKGGLKGYRIELLGVNSKGKPAVETWYITNQIQ